MTSSIMEDTRWATVAPPEHLDCCCVSDVLDANHQSSFATAIWNLLSTDIAEQTFAQIIDGLPLKDVAFSLENPEYTCRDPVFTHAEFCPGVLEKTRMFRDSFNPRSLELRRDVLQRYQEIPAGSRTSKLPLLELIVVAVHTIAAELFELDEGCHQRDTPCTSYRDDEVPHIKPWPTMFAVRAYTNTKQFPRGVADVAGYWAEDIIFGGVVLFGRGESGTGHDGVWFDSHRRGVTYRIYALTDKQLESLLHFLEWEPRPQVEQQAQPPECPLPILGGYENLTRVDPEVAMPLHNIFRDRWEHAISWGSYSEYKMVVKPRPRDGFNYPEIKKKRRMPTARDGNGPPRLTLGDIMMMRRRKDEASASQPDTHDMILEQPVPDPDSALRIPSAVAQHRDESDSLN